jgi:cobalt-zinc-cadmium resistance protein CzcA
LRPILMTSMMAALGLLPAALSHAVGAETARPFAAVIVGGLASVTPLTLFVLPVAMTVLLPLTRRRQAAEPAMAT